MIWIYCDIALLFHPLSIYKLKMVLALNFNHVSTHRIKWHIVCFKKTPVNDIVSQNHISQSILEIVLTFQLNCLLIVPLSKLCNKCWFFFFLFFFFFFLFLALFLKLLMCLHSFLSKLFLNRLWFSWFGISYYI